MKLNKGDRVRVKADIYAANAEQFALAGIAKPSSTGIVSVTGQREVVVVFGQARLIMRVDELEGGQL